ncbi:MAG: helix-turn-helix domain-containing protein, partial [Candidatus Omnitrophica bacterium]|nr:helix-turn-helix domain-containing protein [Candidatus Omnitrophota bacterium]
MEDFLTPTQLAKELKISRQAVIDRIKRGSIKAIKVGRQYIIPQGHRDSELVPSLRKMGKKESKIKEILRI